MKRSTKYTLLWLLILAEFGFLHYLQAEGIQAVAMTAKIAGILIAAIPFGLLFHAVIVDEQIKPWLKTFCKAISWLFIISFILGIIVEFMQPA